MNKLINLLINQIQVQEIDTPLNIQSNNRRGSLKIESIKQNYFSIDNQIKISKFKHKIQKDIKYSERKKKDSTQIDQESEKRSDQSIYTQFQNKNFNFQREQKLVKNFSRVKSSSLFKHFTYIHTNSSKNELINFDQNRQFYSICPISTSINYKNLRCKTCLCSQCGITSQRQINIFNIFRNKTQQQLGIIKNSKNKLIQKLTYKQSDVYQDIQEKVKEEVIIKQPIKFNRHLLQRVLVANGIKKKEPKFIELIRELRRRRLSIEYKNKRNEQPIEQSLEKLQNLNLKIHIDKNKQDPIEIKYLQVEKLMMTSLITHFKIKLDVEKKQIQQSQSSPRRALSSKSIHKNNYFIDEINNKMKINSRLLNYCSENLKIDEQSEFEFKAPPISQRMIKSALIKFEPHQLQILESQKSPKIKQQISTYKNSIRPISTKIKINDKNDLAQKYFNSKLNLNPPISTQNISILHSQSNKSLGIKTKRQAYSSNLKKRSHKISLYDSTQLESLYFLDNDKISTPNHTKYKFK